MSRRRAIVVGATALLALVAFAAGLLLSRSGQEPDSPPLPSQAAVGRLLSLPLLDPAGSQETTLARWQGKPLIVNFWATWCPPCLTEMPVFSRLQEKHRAVQFVGIAIDTPQNVQAFAAAHPMSYPLLLGSEEATSLLGELGNDRNGLPFTLVIDAAGRVRHVKLGGLSEAETEGIIAALK
jgi:thiol-disulfide isomerase/thioredoxin